MFSIDALRARGSTLHKAQAGSRRPSIVSLRAVIEGEISISRDPLETRETSKTITRETEPAGSRASPTT